MNDQTQDTFISPQVVSRYSIPQKLLLFDNIDGHDSMQSIYNNEGIRLMQLTIFVLLKGEMTILINGQMVKITGGQILTTYPDIEIHPQSASADYQYILFVIYPEMLKSVYEDLQMKYDITSFQQGYAISDVDNNMCRQFLMYYDEMRKECLHEDYQYRNIVVRNIFDVVMIKALHLQGKQDSFNVDPDSRQYIVYQRFLKLLNEKAEAERTVQFYADTMNISPKYLSYVTMQYTGKNASQWIGEYVAVKARTLMSVHHKTSAETAKLLNFETLNSFNRFFKRVTNITPKEYIKSIKI